MSIQATYKANISLVETFESFADPADATATFDGLNTEVTLGAATSPPITKHAEYAKVLSVGAGTIDLTALPVNNHAGSTQDCTGLKVQMAKFQNPVTNANPITVTFGASNPYLLAGAGFKIILQPGEEWTFKGNDTTPDVAGGAKDIDLAGTGSQALNVQLVLG